MMAALTLQEEEILGMATRAWGHRCIGLPVFNLDKSALFHFFLSLFNKNVLKQQHAGNAEKSVEIDVSELLSFQNFLNSQRWRRGMWE